MNRMNKIDEIFGRDRFTESTDMLYQELDSFITKCGLSEHVIINYTLLIATVQDYYNDLFELQQYHRQIFRCGEKIISHIAFRLLEKKPLQVCCEQDSHNAKIATVNERFVLLYVLNYLSYRTGKSHILLQSNPDMFYFSQKLFFLFLKGLHSSQTLEAIIQTFLTQYSMHNE